MLILCFYIFSAKEIKPNGPDIGRKVKKKLDRLPPHLGRREPSPFSSHSKFSPNNSSSNGKSSSYGYGNSSNPANKPFSGFNPVGNNASNNGNSRPSSGKPGAGSSDIAKRPIKCDNKKLIIITFLFEYQVKLSCYCFS